jgi:hypothetical protein
LKPTAGGDTLFDEYARLRSIIQNDGVLSELEAGLHVGQMKAAVDAAQKAISENKPETFTASMNELRDSLLKGEKTGGRAVKSFAQELSALTDYRRSVAGKRRGARAEELSPDAMFGEMRSLSKVIKKNIPVA